MGKGAGRVGSRGTGVGSPAASPRSAGGGAVSHDTIASKAAGLQNSMGRILIADVRDAFPNVSHEQMTQHLLDGQRAGRWVLMPKNLPTDVTSRDRAAGIRIPGVSSEHQIRTIMYLA